MSSGTTPIDIANGNSRQNSTSPRNHSNLTTALQQPHISIREDAVSPAMGQPEESVSRNRQESVAMLSTTPYGARAIPMRDSFRRESNALSGSMMAGGTSWGGISMGSYVRDDILMAGTDPFTFQSPSFHSSSYLPKMEANYMKDYVCCNIRLDSMHELLQHYEETHAGQPTQTMGRTPKDQQFPSSRAANATNTAQNVQQQSQLQQSMNMPLQAPIAQGFGMPAASPLFSGNNADQIGTFDALDDMDMDDAVPVNAPMSTGTNFQPQPQFGRQQPRGPNVNVNIANAFQGQGLQTPVTPRPGQPTMAFPNNPTVSSVNTPALGTQTMSQNTATPDSSMPGTPAEPSDFDYSQLGNLSAADYNSLLQGNYDFSNLNMGNGTSATINDPAKHLLGKQGNKGPVNSALANSSELAKRIRETQLLNSLAGEGGFVNGEIKPFKCPVIGCEKAYKNQNGLKYHKQHGHQNQQLKENPDGSFSIVDPTTSIPYPGTMGMEKEKPYRCEVCGKRYKNLNGLKYHRQHSPPCNPELKAMGVNGAGALPAATPGMNVNVAGAGLIGMNENMSAF